MERIYCRVQSAGKRAATSKASGWSRVVEAVADGDHALDVPGPEHDLVSLLAGLRSADQGGHALSHRDVERAGNSRLLGRQDARPDVLGNLAVRAAVDGQHVSPADDPG